MAELADPREQFKQKDGSYKLTGEEIIQDVITVFPKVGSIMQMYGLHCVGCHASGSDTIIQGCQLHGMHEKDIKKMMDELNVAVNKKIELLEVTDRAVEKVKELRAKDKKDDLPLRIAVIPGGCAGFSYDMDFDEQKDDDKEIMFGDLKVVVDPESMPLLKGSSVDYIDSLMGAGFKIDNPNAQKGCGCGKSFG
ncbi:MAG: iron-sulfur cluster assembly accessory protein [Candidatus Woesearchaeota archaeon]|nr:iron-sulfur cluster assembly accessory protein [Candidatus Woesearchaeota archaeon]